MILIFDPLFDLLLLGLLFVPGNIFFPRKTWQKSHINDIMLTFGFFFCDLRDNVFDFREFCFAQK
jgi:hypothetical protein